MSNKESIEWARDILERAVVFYHTHKDVEEAQRAGESPEEIIEMQHSLQTLNMNDTWAWALGYGVKVADEELPELARLFIAYGYCGILYWVAEKDGWKRSEFEDITRFVQFVREEEKIRKEVPQSNARAYAKRGYILGSQWAVIKGWVTL